MNLATFDSILETTIIYNKDCLSYENIWKKTNDELNQKITPYTTNLIDESKSEELMVIGIKPPLIKKNKRIMDLVLERIHFTYVNLMIANSKKNYLCVNPRIPIAKKEKEKIMKLHIFTFRQLSLFPMQDDFLGRRLWLIDNVGKELRKMVADELYKLYNDLCEEHGQNTN